MAFCIPLPLPPPPQESATITAVWKTANLQSQNHLRKFSEVVQKIRVLDGFNFSNHRRKKRSQAEQCDCTQFVHAVQHHEGQQIFVPKGTVQLELMYVQHHEGQQIFVLKDTVQRELVYVQQYESQQIFVLKGIVQRELMYVQ
jgi:hypothetical protein